MDDNKFTCPVCGMEFKTKEEHDAHHTQMHGSKTMAEMTCVHCGYTTRDQTDMESHKKMHPGMV